MPRLNFALWLLLCCCQCQALSGFKEIPMPSMVIACIGPLQRVTTS